MGSSTSQPSTSTGTSTVLASTSTSTSTKYPISASAVLAVVPCMSVCDIYPSQVSFVYRKRVELGVRARFVPHRAVIKFGISKNKSTLSTRHASPRGSKDKRRMKQTDGRKDGRTPMTGLLFRLTWSVTTAVTAMVSPGFGATGAAQNSA